MGRLPLFPAGGCACGGGAGRPHSRNCFFGGATLEGALWAGWEVGGGGEALEPKPAPD
eukprot:CAMPEP_0185209620 /NCGR_PEP_ID=MMETSP1140-20130426/64108_1 /TAXON_ID=298111 /ORGANISM="Pavlova sp., Strain CCMP459" /LENGTH=57 /DNA_ID=CAMNT_0027777387 /DNA_START=95 /DNA_END=268 /DNA_ORIENTATION=+